MLFSAVLKRFDAQFPAPEVVGAPRWSLGLVEEDSAAFAGHRSVTVRVPPEASEWHRTVVRLVDQLASVRDLSRSVAVYAQQRRLESQQLMRVLDRHEVGTPAFADAYTRCRELVVLLAALNFAAQREHPRLLPWWDLLNAQTRADVDVDADYRAAVEAYHAEQAEAVATAAPPAPALSPRAADGLRAAYRVARDKFEVVREEWTDIVADPLAALEHSELLDVSLPRTAAFVSAYGSACDLDSMYSAFPDDAATAERLVSAFGLAASTWREAKRHAAHVGFSWLPEGEREHAVLASKLLTLAGDTNATLPERAAAAEQALKVLRSIHTVMLPEPALELTQSWAAPELAPAS